MTRANVALAPPNLVITGAWRSGTTLLFLAFPHAYADVVTLPAESDALDTLLPADVRWRVSKRPNDIHRAASIRRAFDPWFIFLLRDPRDCIVSWRAERNEYWLSFADWLRNWLLARATPDDRLVFVRYEELVADPDAVQRELSLRIDGLVPARRLSECTSLMDSGSPIVHQLARNSGPDLLRPRVRPFDQTGVGTWWNDRARIRQQLDVYPELQAVLELSGYEEDDSWQAALEVG